MGSRPPSPLEDDGGYWQKKKLSKDGEVLKKDEKLENRWRSSAGSHAFEQGSVCIFNQQSLLPCPRLNIKPLPQTEVSLQQDRAGGHRGTGDPNDHRSREEICRREEQEQVIVMGKSHGQEVCCSSFSLEEICCSSAGRTSILLSEHQQHQSRPTDPEPEPKDPTAFTSFYKSPEKLMNPNPEPELQASQLTASRHHDPPPPPRSKSPPLTVSARVHAAFIPSEASSSSPVLPKLPGRMCGSTARPQLGVSPLLRHELRGSRKGRGGDQLQTNLRAASEQLRTNFRKLQTNFRPTSDQLQTNFRPTSDQLQTNFRVASDQLQTRVASDQLPTSFIAASDQLQSSFRPTSDQLQTNFRVASEQLQTNFRVASDQLPTSFIAASDQLQSSFRPTSDQLQTNFRVASEQLQTSFIAASDQLQSSFRPTSDQLHSSFRPTSDQLQSSFRPTSE
ncbi:Apolipoprotein A-IV [Oryzias melastigma]|uniref:Apolipoprotein A-IV n=1 Tax=Oryzias melastigma TaxID=30732 RepID=A0A834FFZ6_ORYME|nr:Apolipoprotein A-IV [Oryzias melastigma]